MCQQYDEFFYALLKKAKKSQLNNINVNNFNNNITTIILIN